MSKNPVLVEYKAIIKRLEQDLALEVTIPAATLTDFKRQLSQAKFRMNVEGRLSYSEKADEAGNWVVSIVLHPKSSKAAAILSMNAKGGF